MKVPEAMLCLIRFLTCLANTGDKVNKKMPGAVEVAQHLRGVAILPGDLGI